MEPTNFDEANLSLGPPEGMTEDEVRTLRVWRGTDEDMLPVVISCWKPTQEEIDEIQKTGRVWLRLYGQSMPPAAIQGHSPFDLGEES